MRVLITGVTSDLGRAFARTALGAGHDVLGVGVRPHRYLEPGVALTVGDTADAAALVPRCDVVVHLAPVEREVPHSGGIPALRTLATAAARHGVRFVVPLAHGPDVSDADRVVRDSGAEHVVVRTAPLGGRLLDWQACRTVATLLSAPKDTQWRLLHTDDLLRFLLFAVSADRTGAVSLVAPGIVSAGQAREPLRALTSTPAVRGIPCWPEMSTSDKKNSAREWGFECGWTSEEVVADLARGARGRRLGRDGAVDLPARLPMPSETPPRRRPPEDGTVLVSVALPSMAVECDDRIDPRFAVFDANRTAEAFPGPLTPLSIDLHSSGLRAATRVTGRMMGLRAGLADEWEGRAYAVFGHRLYAGVSASVATAPLLPGWSEKAVVERALGDDADGVDLDPSDRPSPPAGLRRVAARFAAVFRFAALALRHRANVRQFAAAAAAEHLDDAALATLDGAALDVRARLVRDRIGHGWVLTEVGALVARTAAMPLRLRAKGDDAVLDRGADGSASAVFAEVGVLAERLRADPDLLVLAELEGLEPVRSRSPEFAAVLDEVLSRIGHRGPAEAELSNDTFARRAELVLAAAVNTARQPPARPARPPEPQRPKPSEEDTPDAAAPEPEPPGSTEDGRVRVRRGLTGKLAAAGQRTRELAWDATMRYTDELRRLVREWGWRQVRAGRLDDVEDAFHLTLEELLALPADARERVRRRRADLERLRAVRMPDVVNGSWRPRPEPGPLPAGEPLTGLGVSAGVVLGRVRVVPDGEEADLGRGEVLVTRVADVGHTVSIGFAAAVVTDLGDRMSRAAIVARRAGVPCVVNTKEASARLVTGTVVRVDGDAGTVAVVEQAPLSHSSAAAAG